jgi:plasmid stability protein
VPALQVRDLPDHLYRKLVEKAAAEHRSIAQETVVLLEKALEMETRKKTTRRMLIEKILRTPPLVDPLKIPASAELLREDRER